MSSNFAQKNFSFFKIREKLSNLHILRKVKTSVLCGPMGCRPKITSKN